MPRIPEQYLEEQEQGKDSNRSQKDDHTDQSKDIGCSLNPFDDHCTINEDMPQLNEDCESSNILLSFANACNPTHDEKQPDFPQEIDQENRPQPDNISQVLNLSYKDYDFGLNRSESPLYNIQSPLQGLDSSKEHIPSKHQKEIESIVNQHMNEINKLITKSRIIEKYIITCSDEPIYQEDTNFASENQEEENDKRREDQFRKMTFVYLRSQPEKTPSHQLKKTNRNRPMEFKDDTISFMRSNNLGNLLTGVRPRVDAKTKQIFRQVRTRLEKRLRQIRQKEKQLNIEHQCRICKKQFNNGRQLGGHMSRKHPGNSTDYTIKKEMQRIKEVEKNRRNYFKAETQRNN